MSNMIISVTPDLALDEGYTYAGGMGVLEGDKFYGAAKLGLPYKALTLFYRNGYVDYEFDEEGNPIPKPQEQPREFLDNLKSEGVLKVRLKGEEVKVEVLKYTHGTAEAVFFNPVEPEWAYHLTDRIYIERDEEEKFYKYTLLAKASAEYIKQYVGVENVNYIDLQEAYAGILPLILRLPGRYRLVIHTPGPWGHPSFPREFFEREFNYRFISPQVCLTEVGLAMSAEAFTVSAKQFDVMSEIIPHFTEKLRYVTNGVNIERWMDHRLRETYESGQLYLDNFIKIREQIKEEFTDFLRMYKDDVDVGDRLTVAWCRRLVPYKRPEFVVKAVNDLPSEDVFFVIAGKAHPYNGAGLEYMKIFRKLHMERGNVVYIPDYTVQKAKVILKSVDLLLFTPFPGWEACGTSYMKAAINGIPTLASPEGGVIEFVVDNVNGWLFGKDIREMVEPNSERGREINEAEYAEFRDKLRKIVKISDENVELYYKVSMNALTTFVPRVGIERVLREYYPHLVKVRH